MRLIDADALKELLIDTLESIKKNPKMDGQEAHIIAACHMLTEMIDDASTVSTARNGWISVKDRLPESGVHVLLCCEMHRHGGEIVGKYVCDGYYAEANKIIAGGFPDECDCEYSEEDDEYYLREGWYEVIKNWDDYNSVTVGDFVTHWMPLPEPPETLIKEDVQ